MKKKPDAVTETTHSGRTSQNQRQNKREGSERWEVIGGWCHLSKQETESFAVDNKVVQRCEWEDDVGFDSGKVVEDQGDHSKNFQKQKPQLGPLR